MSNIRTLAVVLALVACSCAGPATDPGPSARITDTALEVRTGTFEVPPGESLTCFYTSLITDRELPIAGATGMQGEGGHHITLYYTEATGDPEHHPCTESEMASWRMVAGTGGEPGAGDDQSLPPRMALRIPSGVQIVIQAHYINTSGAPMEVSDELAANILAPSDIDEYAAMFVVHEDRFEIPARTAFETVSECVLTDELSIVLLMGHMHSSGTMFALERIAADGTATELYRHDWESAFASHPPVNRYTLAEPLILPAGTRLRQTCRWQNATDASMVFPTEMCDGVMFYFPDDGTGMRVCTPDTVDAHPL